MIPIARASTQPQKCHKRNFAKSLSYHSMVLPLLVLYGLFVIYPFLSTFFYSFTDYSSMKMFDFGFAGLKNYLTVFQTKTQMDAILHTIQYAVILTVAQTLLALPLAVFLNTKLRGRNILRSIFFFPAVLSPIVVGYLWGFLFSTSAYGPINNLLKGMGLPAINFFGDPDLALYSIIFTQVWQWTGWSMVIILANLQSIDPAYYEAARIDGAGPIQSFFRITLPLLYPSVNVLVVTGLVGGLKVYDIIVSTTGGGPFNATSTIIQSIINQAIGGGQYSLGAAYSVIFFIIVLIFTWLVMLIMRKWEEAIQ